MWELLHSFGDVMQLQSPPPSLPDLIAMVTCGVSTSVPLGAEIAAAEPSACLNMPLATTTGAEGATATPGAEEGATAAPASGSIRSGAEVTEQAELRDSDGPSGEKRVATTARSKTSYYADPAAAIAQSAELLLDLSRLLPGEAVEALGQWMQDDAFLTRCSREGRKGAPSTRCMWGIAVPRELGGGPFTPHGDGPPPHHTEMPP